MKQNWLRRVSPVTMTSTSKKLQRKLILWALAWALALIASAFLFKGNPFKDWIQSALFRRRINFLALAVPKGCFFSLLIKTFNRISALPCTSEVETANRPAL
jgi:hypothetical protein